MRPPSIIWFERVYLGSLVLGLVNSALSYNQMKQALAADPATAATGMGGGFMIGTIAVSFAFSLLFWYLIVRRASNVARWIYVVMSVIGLGMLPFTFAETAKMSVFGVAPALIGTALQIAALVLLFLPDARAWFANPGRSSPRDARVFD